MNKMAKCQLIKAFLQSYSEFLQNRNDASLNAIHRNLKILSVTADLSIFDPDTCEATEFYVSLHELMKSLQPHTGAGVVWIAIDVLQHCCKNPAARSALTDIYKFTPILSQILKEHLTSDRRIKVLKLLEVLTYSAKITWQEAHLTSLVTTLTHWIMSDEEQTVIDTSLSVLVNLCYKNLPSLYTLMHGVDMKEFLRSLSKLQTNISCQVQICKMMLILEEINGPLEENAIESFVRSMFSRISRAYSNKEVYAIRHIVDFFFDIRTNNRLLKILHKDASFQKDGEKLIGLVINETEPDQECIGLVFELFNVLLELKVPGLSPLYLQLISLAMRWIQTELVCTPALLLIRSINEASRDTPQLADEILEEIKQGLEVLLLVLDSGDEPSAASRLRQPSLMQLLCSMLSAEPFRRKLLDRLKPAVIAAIFNSLSAPGKPINSQFDKDTIRYFVNSINLVSCLADHDALWGELLSSLITSPQIISILADALVTGDTNVKELVLQVIDKDSFPKEQMKELAAAMCDTETQAKLPKRAPRSDLMGSFLDDLAPLVSVKEEAILSKFIKKLEEADERNEIKDVATSAVMQLYEYKLAARGSFERALNDSLEAATNQTIHLQHQVARLSAKTSQFHKLLFHNQQSIEGLREEKACLVAKLNNFETKVSQLNGILASKQMQVKSSEESLAAKCAQLEEARRRVDDMETESAFKEKKNLAILADLKNDIQRLQERIDKRNAMLTQKDKELAKQNQYIEISKSEKANLEQVYQAQLLDIKEKDALIDKLSEEIKDHKKFREAVLKMASTQSDK